MLLNKFQIENYNTLYTVEKADELVRRNGLLNKVLSEAANLFVKYDVHKRFGISLIHKHNDCLKSTYMIESFEKYNSEDALITRLSKLSPESLDAIPAVWILINNHYLPLEFTTDIIAKEQYFQVINPMFLMDLKGILIENEVTNLLGLSILDRLLYQKITKSEIAVEYSTTECENIVMIRELSLEKNKVIETNWRFSEEIDTAKTCTRQCLRVCNKVCWTLGEGGHNQSHQNIHGGQANHL